MTGLFRPLVNSVRTSEQIVEISQALVYQTQALGALSFRQIRSASSEQRSLFKSAIAHPGFVIVPQQAAYVVERLGRSNSHSWAERYHKRQCNVIAVSTRWQVTIQLDGVLYIKVENPYDAAYGVLDPIYAVTQLAQTTMRSELGKLTLDETFLERDSLNAAINRAINSAALTWGVRCMRYEIRDIIVPSNIRAAMEKQAEAERRKRAEILQSEGERESEINLSLGRKQALILHAEGEAESVRQRAQATAQGLRLVAEAINSEDGRSAVAMQLAEQYMEAFSKLAKEGNTIIIPAGVDDPTTLIAKGLSVFKALDRTVKNEMVSK